MINSDVENNKMIIIIANYLTFVRSDDKNGNIIKKKKLYILYVCIYIYTL